ncbi:MAG: hypothetical protein ABIA21_03865 [Candidatus Aenigmatarchaeota archaeon]
MSELNVYEVCPNPELVLKQKQDTDPSFEARVYASICSSGRIMTRHVPVRVDLRG